MPQITIEQHVVIVKNMAAWTSILKIADSSEMQMSAFRDLFQSYGI
jgi:hypothetical protein